MSAGPAVTPAPPETELLLATPNLAAGRPATQSSTWGPGAASRAVDGNVDSNWNNNSVSHTGFDAQAWWQVDLGAAASIGEVVLYNRTDCCGERLSDFDLQVSINGIDWLTAASFAGPAPARATLSTQAFARFVRVRLRGTNYLSLAEVQVFAAQNLAAGRPATQSSTWGPGAASRAVDGNVDGNWSSNSVSHTGFDAQAWWQVDLGAAASIGEVVLYNRTDCCGERLSDFDLQVSNDGINWQTAASFTGPAPARTSLYLQASARFVRVRLRGTNYLSLAEVQVFAPQNLAIGKPATQSSTWGPGAASRAVDGNVDGNWSSNSVSHTGFDAQAWWQVDLGAVTGIGRVVLYNRTDCCGERLSDFDLQVSPNGTDWQTATSFTGPAPARTSLAVQAFARFVRVRLRGTNYLSLAEVQVFAAQNLAAGRPATQSSTWGPGAASRAVDGNVDGNWSNNSVTHTGFDAQAWWQVDLGAATSIGEVVLYNRIDCCGERLSDFDLQVSNDGINWLTAASFTAPAPARTSLTVWAFARFVRVRLRGTNYLSLAEVQVFAP